ncbi:MAG: zinc ribbon domain-containing protein [Proteobacteria bacterium]|nr:zinc ribbon domain-containing protein [Pseudomonadota bacterium]
MPLFEYRCPTCGACQEVLARSAETVQPPRCAVCGVAMDKQLAAVAAHTRGGSSGAGCAAPRGGFS